MQDISFDKCKRFVYQKSENNHRLSATTIHVISSIMGLSLSHFDRANLQILFAASRGQLLVGALVLFVVAAFDLLLLLLPGMEAVMALNAI